MMKYALLAQNLAPGKAMEVARAEVKEHSTQPPGRFSEGTLVKELEALGIGRPSTYSSIIRLLQVRLWARVASAR